MTQWEIFEECSSLMVEYRERFGVNVPCFVMFYPMEEISVIVRKALEDNKVIEKEN